MKKILVLFVFCLVTAHVFAQQNEDSLAYAQQGKKITAMLARRAKKFGQYSRSLRQHTGIFGMQTKNDIRNSNGILMDIVKTDDSVYKEIKILLSLGSYRQSQFQSQAQQSGEGEVGYMGTINKLRNHVDQLKKDSEKQQREADKTNRIFIIAIIVMAAIILVLLRIRTKAKPKPKPSVRRR